MSDEEYEDPDLKDISALLRYLCGPGHEAFVWRVNRQKEDEIDVCISVICEMIWTGTLKKIGVVGVVSDGYKLMVLLFEELQMDIGLKAFSDARVHAVGDTTIQFVGLDEAKIIECDLVVGVFEGSLIPPAKKTILLTDWDTDINIMSQHPTAIVYDTRDRHLEDEFNDMDIN